MSDPTEPFEGYDDLNVDEVVTWLESLPAEDVEAVKAYEAATQDRKTITEWEPQPAPPEPTQDADAPLQPEGRPTLQEVAEQAAEDQRVEEAPNYGGNQ